MVIIHFLVSFVASIVGAISGIGGGVIIKPSLDAISPLGPTTLSFLSSCTVLAMTMVALIRSRNNSIVLDRNISIFMALGGICGGLIGKWIFTAVQQFFTGESMIGAVQSIILMALTFGVLLISIFKSRVRTLNAKHWSVAFFAGICLGSIATFLGIGGGPFNLTVLYLLFSMDSKTAALNSIFIIFFSQMANLILTIGTGRIPPFPTSILVFMVLGGISGGMAGIYFSKKMTNRQVDILFAIVTVLIIITSGLNFLKYYGQV